MVDLRAVYIGLPLLAASIFLVLAYLSYQRRREAPGALAFYYLCLALAVWSVGGALESFSGDLSSDLFWGKFKYFGIVAMPPLMMAFALQYTGHGAWFTRRRHIALLTIHPILTLIAIWTTEYNHLFWTAYGLDYTSSFPIFYGNRGIAFWLHSAYSYTLVIIGTVVLIREAMRTLRPYRQRLIILVAACIIPWLANVATLVRLIPLPGLDLTPVMFALTGVAVMWALLRFKVLDIIPIAREAVIESMSDGVIVINSENRIIDLNPVAQRAAGLSVSQAIGRLVGEVFGAYATLIERYRQTLEAQAEVTVEFNGARRHLDLRITPLRNSSGQLMGRLIVYRDITARKQVEEELEKRVHQLATLRQVDEDLSRELDVQYVLSIALAFVMRLADAAAGFIALADDNNVLHVAHLIGKYGDVQVGSIIPQDKGVVGRAARLLKAELVMDVKADPDCVTGIGETRAQIAIPLISQERLIGVLNLETPKAGQFTPEIFEFVKLVTARIAIALDNARLYQVSQTQLAELQALYGKISRLEQLKTDMISIAAHDLGNPITVVSNYAWMLREDLGQNISEEQCFLLDNIEQASDRMQNITRDILSLDRIHRAAETSQTVDLCKLVEDVFQVYQDQAKTKSQAYELTVTDAAPAVSGDVAQLREAMSNLVSNAIKYTPNGGRVDVRLKQITARAIFEVQDTGYGIPANQQEQLFRPFYRAITKETQNIEGVGLGLHLVKNIVERHHGTVIFHSVYGEGSTFGFELPAVRINRPGPD